MLLEKLALHSRTRACHFSSDRGCLSAVVCSRRGDPLSHPSGSGAQRRVGAIYPPSKRKELEAPAHRQFPPALCFCAPSEYPGRPTRSSTTPWPDHFMFSVGARSALTCRDGPQLRAGRSRAPTPPPRAAAGPSRGWPSTRRCVPSQPGDGLGGGHAGLWLPFPEFCSLPGLKAGKEQNSGKGRCSFWGALPRTALRLSWATIRSSLRD